MPIYKVTTEGDCEGRSVNSFGYVKANSMEHALRHLFNKGSYAMYQYTICAVDDFVDEAIGEDHLTHLDVELSRCSWSKSEFKGTVTPNEEVLQRKREKVAQILKDNGLTVSDVIQFGGDYGL